jgi:hypothetical protein
MVPVRLIPDLLMALHAFAAYLIKYIHLKLFSA